MTLQYSEEFASKGYTLNRFRTSDTRCIGVWGEVYKYYAATKDGRFQKGFKDIKAAALWIEFRRPL